MKNKIGILENDIYIFPHISHSEYCYLLSAQFSHGLEGSTAIDMVRIRVLGYFQCCVNALNLGRKVLPNLEKILALY